MPSDTNQRSIFWLGQRVFALLLLCLFLVQCLPLRVQAAADQPVLTEDHHALPNFASHMPLLSLEFSGDTIATEQDDFYLDAQIQGFDGAQANTLQQAPVFSHMGMLRNLTETENQTDQKHDYYLRLGNDYSLLGLGVASEYLLLGGMNDKSLVRNYIGYSIAADIMESPVDARLCELFFQTEEGAQYQGVYLLVRMQPREEGNAFLFHRGTSGNEDGIPVYTYAGLNDPASGYISIPFMESTRWDDRFNGPIGGLSQAEAVLYSTDSRTFYTYANWFDVPSFTAALILGELTENYAGMFDAYYYYDVAAQKLSVAPMWNFDQAFDNQADTPAATNKIQYDEAPYYEQFFKSPQFTRQMQEHYVVLRKDILNESALEQRVEEAVVYVKPAVARDWARWGDYQSHVLQPITKVEAEDETLKAIVPFARQTDTYEDEILRLKVTLREHSIHMARAFTQFDFSEREISREIVLNINPIWAIVFLVVFFALVRFARRYGV